MIQISLKFAPLGPNDTKSGDGLPLNRWQAIAWTMVTKMSDAICHHQATMSQEIYWLNEHCTHQSYIPLFQIAQSSPLYL